MDQARKACSMAAELLKPTGADASLRPLLREAVLTIGADCTAARELIAAAAGEPPAGLGEAIAQNPDKADGYRNRGNWYADRARWKEAIADYGEVFRTDPNSLDALRLGILLAYHGDKGRYREHCQAMLARWSSTQSNSEADQTLKAIILMPNARADAKQLARLATVAVSGDEKQSFYEWFLFGKGLHDFRTGKYADALAASRASRQRSGADELRALNLVLEALAQEGAAENARRTLSEAKAMLDRHVPGIDGFSADWLFAHILYREAEGLIASKKSE
jgi:tetratricopeptide (TPR) repeat protein